MRIVAESRPLLLAVRITSPGWPVDWTITCARPLKVERRHPGGGRPRFLFQRREKSRPASYPIHLDFGSDDREADVERLTRAGASVVETKVGTNITFTIMRDPEGNPFCVG